MSSFSRTIESDLRSRVRGSCFFDADTRRKFSTDESWYRVTPVAVVQPLDAEDVRSVVEYCARQDIPVIPRGGATGLAGQAIGLGVILDFTHRMNRILDISADAVRVEPGMTVAALNDQLRPKGTFLPIDPASGNRCTLGGMIGTNAAGAHGIKYGAMKNVVQELKVVLSNGELATIGSPTAPVEPSSPFFSAISSSLSPLLMSHRDLIRSRFPDVAKNSSGYNLRDAVAGGDVDYRKILIGSEGTLGVVVEATLRVVPIPAYRIGALVSYDTYEKAAEATMIGVEHRPAAIEILDDTYVALVKGSDAQIDALIPEKARAILYFEFESSSADEVSRTLMQLNRSLSITLPVRFFPLTREEELRTVWRMREEASSIINTKKSGGKTSFVEDVAVPLSSLGTYIAGLREILQSHGIEFSIYGHAGTGNVHCAAFVNLTRLEHYKAIDTIAHEVYALARSLGGTHSGEHGDGFVRTPFLEDLYGSEIYGLFRSVKRAFDPNNILNPGKIIGQQHVSILHDLDIA